jgi:hypothetical protein
MARLLVVLPEVDTMGIALSELERDAPRPVDVNGVSIRAMPPEGMKVKTGNIHILWTRRLIESIQTPENAVVHAGVDLPR